MKRKLVTSLALVLSLVGGFSSSAHATLMGDTVHIAQNYDLLGEEHYPVDAVVSDGIEFNWVYTVDVGADYIAVDFFQNVSFVDTLDTLPYFNGPVVLGLDDSSGNVLDSFTLSSNHSGVTSSRIFFGDDWLGFNLNGLSFTSGQSLVATLDFQAAPVPEPSTFLLLGSGLAGLVWFRRKRTI